MRIQNKYQNYPFTNIALPNNCYVVPGRAPPGPLFLRCCGSWASSIRAPFLRCRGSSILNMDQYHSRAITIATTNYSFFFISATFFHIIFSISLFFSIAMQVKVFLRATGPGFPFNFLQPFFSKLLLYFYLQINLTSFFSFPTTNLTDYFRIHFGQIRQDCLARNRYSALIAKEPNNQVPTFICLFVCLKRSWYQTNGRYILG